MLELWLLSFAPGYYFRFILITLVLLASVTTAFHAVIYKKEPRAALGWFIFIVSAPIIGTLGYIFLGLNRVNRKGLKLDSNYLKAPSFQQIDGKVSPEFQSIFNVGESLSFSPVCSVEDILPLNSGDEAYPKMLEAIEKAESSIFLYSYIFEFDRAGEQFVEVLERAQKRGVLIRVLVDGVGSQSSIQSMRKVFKKLNIPFLVFLPVLWRPRLANLRNHRKILVVDGVTAFAGGLNIAEEYWPQLVGDKGIFDFHFLLKGGIVRYIEAVFIDDWYFVSKENLTEAISGRPDVIADKNASSAGCARVVVGGPGENAEKIQWHFVGAINDAKKSIRIITPYFLPSTAVQSALISASLRGVKVEIILPQKTDNLIVSWAMEADLFEILYYGCEVWYSKPPFDHSKLLVVDDDYTSLGSANWDVRSFRLNFEMNVEVSGDQLAQKIIKVFESKKQNSKQYFLNDYNKRPFLVKLRGGLSRLLNPYL